MIIEVFLTKHSNTLSMRKILKVLSHKDRVFGRIISGGSLVSKDREGKILVEEIKNGFFEKKMLKNGFVSHQLYLPYSMFNAFRNTHLN